VQGATPEKMLPVRQL